MLASFDPASNVVVIRSLITLSVVHSLTCDASAADNNAPPLAPPPPLAAFGCSGDSLCCHALGGVLGQGRSV